MSLSSGTPVWNTGRQVQPDECSQANTNSTTPSESGGSTGGGGGGDGGGDGGGGDGDYCGSGKEGYAIDCGSNGTWDHVVCLDWWENPYEEAARRCGVN